MAEAVGVRAVRSGGHLERMLASGAFAVTAEIAPPASADPTDIREMVSRYRGAVDACNVTDCTRARVRLSSIGAAADPFRGSKEESFAKLRAKVLAGADFVQTQAVYDIDAFEEWMRLVRKEWLHEKAYILAGVIPLRSVKMARFMVEKLGATV